MRTPASCLEAGSVVCLRNVRICLSVLYLSHSFLFFFLRFAEPLPLGGLRAPSVCVPPFPKHAFTSFDVLFTFSC